MGRFWSYRGTTRALIVWSAFAIVLLAVRLPFEHWHDQCSSPPGLQGLATVCTKANAPTTLVFVLVAWLIGVVIIGIVRYVPLPTAKR